MYRRLAGCPIYTRTEIVADTLVHVVGVPFGFAASYIMLEEVHARLPQVRTPAAPHAPPASRPARPPVGTVAQVPCACRGAAGGVRCAC